MSQHSEESSIEGGVELLDLGSLKLNDASGGSNIESEDVLPSDTAQLIRTVSDDELHNLTSTSRCYGMLDIQKEFEESKFDPHRYFSSHRMPKGPRPYECAGLSGLRNIGNTCYMNSILQCLSNTEPLLQYCLLSEKYKDDLSSASSMKGDLFKAFVKLIHDIWNQEGRDGVDTSNLKEKIQKFCPTFLGARQHDSQELLRFLLDGLHRDVNKVTQKPKQSLPIITDDLSDVQKSKIFWNWNLRFDDSQIADIFVGQLKSTLTCLTCFNRSVTFDPFWDLSISLSSTRGPVNLEDCLQLFTQEETLDGDEKPKCEKCNKNRKSTKRFTIEKFPDIMVIHLKRFTRDDRGKLRTVVKFPMTNLEMGKYAEEPVKNCSYNLYGISNHFGTAFSGHYIAYCKHPFSKDWHCYDDSRVTSVNAEEVEVVEAYLLFYDLSVASKCLMER